MVDMKRLKFLICGVVLAGVASASHPSFAAFDSIKNAPAVVTEYTQVKVHKDGSQVANITREILIQSQEGVSDFGVFSKSYEPARERLRILKMETHNGDYIQPVLPSAIEDKPVASDSTGFDDKYRLRAVFPSVREGSTLHADIQYEMFRPLLPGVFSRIVEFGADVPYEHHEILLDSELPLFWKAHDRWGVLDIRYTNKDGIHTLHVKTVRPSYFKIINEIGKCQSDEDKPYVLISTLHNWGDLGSRLSALWEVRLQKELPKSLEQIAAKVNAQESDETKLDELVSLLSKHFRYHGDWRPVEGSDVPHQLADIAERGYGDCKDFSAVSVAILRRAGLEAYPAFVTRTAAPPTLSIDIPVLDAFDHAIVYVRGRDGRDLWLDATNAFRPSSPIPSDISDRPALILAGESSKLLHIPAQDPSLHRSEKRLCLSAANERWISCVVTTKYSGNSAFDINRSIVFEKKDLAEEVESKLITTGFKIRDFVMLSKPPDTLSNPFNFESNYSFYVKDIFYRSGTEIFFVLPGPSFVDTLVGVDPLNRGSSLQGPQVGTYHSEIDLKSWHVLDSPPNGCNINTEWFTLERVVADRNGALVVCDKTIIKKPVIPVERLRSIEFARVLEEVNNCFMMVGVSLQEK